MNLQKIDAKTAKDLPYKLPTNSGLASVADLVPYARNARLHSPQQVAQLRASIREFGWTNPVLCKSNGDIIAGHGRVLAAQAEGFATVPVVVLDHLSDAQVRALRIADNKHAANSTWDWQLLSDELKELHALDPDLDSDHLGFADVEMRTLLAAEFVPPGDGNGEGAGTTTVGGQQYLVLTECESEVDQASLFEELKERGFSCKVMN